MNRQNNRWLRSNPRIVPVIMSMKFPTAVMVVGVISNEGDFWGKEVYPHNTLDSLKTAMVAEFAGMPFAEMTRACSRYLSRIQHVIPAEGGFIELTISFIFL